MTYTYDTWGNITEKKIYAYTTATNPGTPSQTIPYVYSTGTWKDQLTSYNGQTISYDAMGNPTSYRGKTLAWNGKELTGVTGTATYTYDMNGLRTTKVAGGTTTNYFYNNTVLMGLTTGTTYLLFSYDAAGLVQAVNYNGTYYYYLRNGQGDIVKLIDGSGNTVVEYAYDSWGNQLSCTGTLATTLGALNPFRYRGYVYDEETGFYYLKSRYYDPETCRFISADVLLSTGQGVLGNNCYTYCLNNPADFIDSSGKDAIILYDSDAVGHIGALIQDSDGKWWHFYWGTSNDWTRVACVFGFDVSPLTWCVPYTGEIDLEQINDDESYGGAYEEMLYLYGDFSFSATKAKDPGGLYNLYTNNCAQVTLSILADSGTIYCDALSAGSNAVLPRNAFASVKREIEGVCTERRMERFIISLGRNYVIAA